MRTHQPTHTHTKRQETGDHLSHFLKSPYVLRPVLVLRDLVGFGLRTSTSSLDTQHTIE